MKETLFRGKTLPKENKNHEFDSVWVYGDLIIDKATGKYYIHPQNNSFKTENEIAKTMVVHEVDKKTIGQYTGLTDKYREMIFEGDIISYIWDTLAGKTDEKKYLISYNKNKAKFIADCITNNYSLPTFEYVGQRGEIIGNCWDNPELVKSLCDIE